MLGKALEDDQLQVSLWFEHARNQVPVYAHGVGGVQVPFVRAGTSPFHVGELPPHVRGQVPVGQTRAVVVQPLITMDEDGRMGPDRAGVIPAFARGVRAEADDAESWVAYFDTAQFDGGWQLVGSYSRRAEGLRFSGTLYGPQTTRLDADAPNAELLADELVERVVEAARP